MPLPNPRSGEEKTKYIPRCVRFVYRESTRHRPRAQVVAMCIANWESHHRKHQRFLGKPAFKQLGNALLVEGDLLRPGVWIGLDGVPTHYSEKFISKVNSTIIGKPIRFAHSISPKSMLRGIPKGTTVGFWTGFKGEKKLKARGYVFDPIAIEYVRKHPNEGLSMEAQVYAEFNPKLGVEDAKSGTLTGGVLIDDPACPACRLTSIREVSLSGGNKIKKMKGVLNVSGEETEELEEETEEEEESEEALANPEQPCFEPKELAKGTRKEFFTNLEKQLRDAKLEDKLVKAILKVLRKAITTPFPIPMPKAKSMETAEEIELAANDLWAQVKAKLKAAGVDEAVVNKVVSALKGVIKVPYPYPKAQEELVKELASVRAELKVLTDERDARREGEFETLLGEVKKYDKDFDPKLLESIECIDMKKVFLERYLSTVKKTVKPISLQVDPKNAEAKVKAAVASIFGEGVTFNQIFDIPEVAGDK